MSTHKIVIDTNIFVSALLSQTGAANLIYRMFLSGELTLVYNEDILAEYEDVVYRPHLNIVQNDAHTLLANIQQYGELIKPSASKIDMIDEDDRIFYDTAKEAGAHLITRNLKHYPNEPHILEPSAYLDYLRKL